MTDEERSWEGMPREQLLEVLKAKDRMFRHLIDLNIKERKRAEEGRETDRQRLMKILNAVLTKYGVVRLSKEDLEAGAEHAVMYLEDQTGSGSGTIVFTRIGAAAAAGGEAGG